MTNQSWQAEYDELTSAGGSISLAGWTQVHLTGSDRATFLHNMCTNDIRRLEVGQTCEAFCTDVKGKVLTHVLVIVQRDKLVLLTVPEQGPRLVSHLERYIIREEVQLADESEGVGWQYVIGPKALPLADAYECKLLWPGGYLVSEAATLPEPPPGPLTSVTSPTFTALRVESFWPLFGKDFGEENLPQEVNRDSRAISFTKGCYLGQETVARIDALGHVNKKLVLMRLSGRDVPVEGTKTLSGDQEVGVVTSSSWSPRFAAALAIAMVRRGFNEAGTKLQCGVGEATVMDLADGGKS